MGFAVAGGEVGNGECGITHRDGAGIDGLVLGGLGAAQAGHFRFPCTNGFLEGFGEGGFVGVDRAGLVGVLREVEELVRPVEAVGLAADAGFAVPRGEEKAAGQASWQFCEGQQAARGRDRGHHGAGLPAPLPLS